MTKAEICTLIKALIDIQAFDGGYHRAWEIAESAFKQCGFENGLQVRRYLSEYSLERSRAAAD